MTKVLVTGASRGIGHAIVHQLLQQGMQVVGTSRQPQTLDFKHVAFTPAGLDLEELVNNEAVIQTFCRRYGDIDVLILNAGQGRFGGLEEFSYRQIHQFISINLIAQIQLVRAYIQSFKIRGSGDFIFIGSESALTGGRQGSIYSAAKFGIRGFAQALRQECTGHNIRVGLINPGMVSSSFFDQLSFKPGDSVNNSILPEQVADAVALMLNSKTNVVWDEINLSPLKKVVKKKQND